MSISIFLPELNVEVKEKRGQQSLTRQSRKKIKESSPKIDPKILLPEIVSIHPKITELMKISGVHPLMAPSYRVNPFTSESSNERFGNVGEHAIANMFAFRVLGVKLKTLGLLSKEQLVEGEKMALLEDILKPFEILGRQAIDRGLASHDKIFSSSAQADMLNLLKENGQFDTTLEPLINSANKYTGHNNVAKLLIINEHEGLQLVKGQWLQKLLYVIDNLTATPTAQTGKDSLTYLVSPFEKLILAHFNLRYPWMWTQGFGWQNGSPTVVKNLNSPPVNVSYSMSYAKAQILVSRAILFEIKNLLNPRNPIPAEDWIKEIFANAKYDFWENKRVVVTGGAGFLGQYVVNEIKKMGVKKIIVPRKKKFDLRKEAKNLAVTKRADLVIHLAGEVGGIIYNQRYPARLFYDNLMMGTHLIEACRKNNVGKLVIIGTICSYPKHTPVPFKEHHLWKGYPEETNAPYGIAKKAILVQSQAYTAQHGLNTINLLPVNLYGPGDHFDPERSHVIPALVRKFIEAKKSGAKKVTVLGSGRATREFLYARDAARAIVAATEKLNSCEPVNIGAGFEISIKDLAELIKELVGYKGEIVWDTTKPDGQPRRMLDTSKAKRLFGFEAETDFRTGLKKTIEWYLKNYLQR